MRRRRKKKEKKKKKKKYSVLKLIIQVSLDI